MQCSKCNAENPENSLFCNSCGTKQLSNKAPLVPKEPHSLNRNKVLLSILMVLLLAIGVYFFQPNTGNSEQYAKDLSGVVDDMLSQRVILNPMARAYSGTWKNILEGMIAFDRSEGLPPIQQGDINGAISWVKREFQKKGLVSTLNETNEKIDARMKKLNNPPSEYKEASKIAFEIYSLYTEYYSLIISPKGSLLSFNSKVRELESGISTKEKLFYAKYPSSKK